jgi:hypothetical protein
MPYAVTTATLRHVKPKHKLRKNSKERNRLPAFHSPSCIIIHQAKADLINSRFSQ